MKLILGLVGLLVVVSGIVSFFTHLAVVYYASFEVSTWWGVFLTFIGLMFADFYWAYQWWGSSFAVFILVVSVLFAVLQGLVRGLEFAATDVE